MDDNIIVSIICNTYNHENYIAEAIESFLAQKTNFKYEILIHDDASTDKTAEIIRGYEVSFPDIIKPIYQKENQYSKGIMVGWINRARAIGKYYAICEGDDYWSTPTKLQEQVEYMEEHTECIASVHAALCIDSCTKKIIGKKRPDTQDREFSVEEIIEGGGGLFATNSLLYRKDLGDIRPHFYYQNTKTFSDYQLMILLSLIGKVYYIDKFMSVYRTNVPGSWTYITSISIERTEKQVKDVNSMLDEVNEYTNGKYISSIEKTKLRNEFNLLIFNKNYNQIKIGKYKTIYDNLCEFEKFKIFIKQYLPNTANMLKTIKRT